MKWIYYVLDFAFVVALIGFFYCIGKGFSYMMDDEMEKNKNDPS